MKYKINVGLTTHQGGYRASNEDNYLYRGNYLKQGQNYRSLRGKGKVPMLIAICDGMGGSNYGKEASTLAIRTLKNNCNHLYNAEKKFIEKELELLIQKTNDNVCLLKEQNKKTGTTLAMVFLQQDHLYIANIGDSRIYQFLDDELKQLSLDHNQAEEMIQLGMSREKAEGKRNVLTQYLGMSHQEIIMEPHYNILDYGDMTLLMCSDGLNEVLSDEEIKEILKQFKGKNLKAATNFLITLAIQKGAKDNITAIIIEISSKRGIEK